MSIYKDDPVVGAFSAMLKHYAMMRLLDTVPKLTSPTDISFGDRETADYDEYCLHYKPDKTVIESHFTDDDEIVFYMILDYPIEFSCCHIKDFRQAYLNARSKVRVQLPERYLTWHHTEQEIVIDQIRYEYFKLNRCVPLVHTTFGKLKKIVQGLRIKDYNWHVADREIETIHGIHHSLDHFDGVEEDDFSVAQRMIGIMNEHLTFYRDYLIYCSEYFHAIQNLGYYEYGWKEAKESHNYHKRISNGFRDEVHDFLEHDVDLDIPLGSDCNYLIKNHYPLVDVTGPLVLDNNVVLLDNDDYDNDMIIARRYKYNDTKIWFHDFISEAKKIQDKDNPRYRNMLDIDELYIYDLYKRFYKCVDLEFLKKDWFDKPSWETH